MRLLKCRLSVLQFYRSHNIKNSCKHYIVMPHKIQKAFIIFALKNHIKDILLEQNEQERKQGGEAQCIRRGEGWHNA